MTLELSGKRTQLNKFADTSVYKPVLLVSHCSKTEAIAVALRSRESSVLVELVVH